MNTVEIKITSSGLETNQAQLLANFLTSLNVAGAITQEVAKQAQEMTKAAADIPVIAEEVEAPKKTRNRAKKEATAALADNVSEEDPGPQNATENDIEEEDDEQEEAAPKANLVQIRSLVATKQADHREAIKAQLVKCGANNVPTLPTAHYDAFHAFLDAL